MFERETRVNADLDLTRVALASPIPGIVKPAGRAARATFAVVQRENSIRIDDLVAELGGAAAKGTIELNGQGDFLFGPPASGAAFARRRHARRRAEGGRHVQDQRARCGGGCAPFHQERDADERSGDAQGRGLRDRPEDAGAQRVFQAVARQRGSADRAQERRAARVQHERIVGRGPFSAVLARGDNGQPQVNIATADAGAALGFCDLYSRMEGGALSAAMQFADRSVTGMLSVKNFQLRDEPALRRLVNEGSVRVDSSGARVDPGLIRFDRLSVVFSRAGGQLTLRDGVMNGPNIGLTVEGAVDTDRETMALNGTFIPAYTVNNFFARSSGRRPAARRRLERRPVRDQLPHPRPHERAADLGQSTDGRAGIFAQDLRRVRQRDERAGAVDRLPFCNRAPSSATRHYSCPRHRRVPRSRV